MMQWEIKEDFFQPVRMQYKNQVWRKIQSLLGPIRRSCDECNASLYLRGSALESREPHRQSDIDFVLVAERQYWMDLHRLIRETIQIEQRPVDVFFIEEAKLLTDVLIRLLLHTRSELVAGPTINFAPVEADFTTAKVHWDQFAIHRLPDALISDGHTNACMVKQLLRSIGPIELLRQKRFSRDLPTCLDWILDRAPQKIIPYFQQAWYHIGTQQYPPLVIQPARDWLVQEWQRVVREHSQ